MELIDVGAGGGSNPSVALDRPPLPPMEYLRKLRLSELRKGMLKQIEKAGSSVPARTRELVQGVGASSSSSVAVPHDVDLVVLSPRHFGCETSSDLRSLLDPEVLSEWNRTQDGVLIPAGYRVALLPQEAGPLLRLDYLPIAPSRQMDLLMADTLTPAELKPQFDGTMLGMQPVGESLFVATPLIAGNLLFCVSNNGIAGVGPMLYAVEVTSIPVRCSTKLVFALEPIPQ